MVSSHLSRLQTNRNYNLWTGCNIHQCPCNIAHWIVTWMQFKDMEYEWDANKNWLSLLWWKGSKRMELGMAKGNAWLKKSCSLWEILRKCTLVQFVIYKPKHIPQHYNEDQNLMKLSEFMFYFGQFMDVIIKLHGEWWCVDGMSKQPWHQASKLHQIKS